HRIDRGICHQYRESLPRPSGGQHLRTGEMIMLRLRILPAAAVTAFFLAAAPFKAYAVENLVPVSGESSVSVAPDVAMIRIGVSSKGKDARTASASNAKQMN